QARELLSVPDGSISAPGRLPPVEKEVILDMEAIQKKTRLPGAGKACKSPGRSDNPRAGGQRWQAKQIRNRGVKPCSDVARGVTAKQHSIISQQPSHNMR